MGGIACGSSISLLISTGGALAQSPLIDLGEVEAPPASDLRARNPAMLGHLVDLRATQFEVISHLLHGHPCGSFARGQGHYPQVLATGRLTRTQPLIMKRSLSEADGLCNGDNTRAAAAQVSPGPAS